MLLLLGLALFVVNLGGYPFYTKGEPREAVTVLDMVQGGGFILPLRAGVEVPSKPPLMHWFAAAASLALGGVSEWSVRLPSAICAIAAIIAIYFYGRRLFDEAAGLFAALIFATAFQILQAGSGARVDMTLTFFIQVTIFEFIMIAEGLRRNAIPMYLAAAMAVLAKGPIGVVLPGLIGLAWIAWEGRWNLLRRIGLWWGVPLVLMLAGGWYVAASLIRGEAFIRKQILAENLFRFFHNSRFHEGHAHHFYYLEGALAVGFMPWTLLSPAVVIEYLRRPLRDSRLRFLIVWCVTVLVFYSFPSSKRGAYLLALYPALALLSGIAMAKRENGAESRLTVIVSKIAGVSLAVAAAIGFAALAELLMAPGRLAEVMRLVGWTVAGLIPALREHAVGHEAIALAVLIVAAATGMWLSVIRASGAQLVGGIALAVAALVVGVNMIVAPALADTLTLRGFANELDAKVGNASVAYLGGLNYDVAFYTGRDIPVFKPGQAGGIEYLICARSVYDAMPPRARRHFVVILQSHPTALDGSGAIVLLRRISRWGAGPGTAPIRTGSGVEAP
jgi:4-amino-4-deoxy-L-arabinose transferase-like glycosyltransferase